MIRLVLPTFLIPLLKMRAAFFASSHSVADCFFKIGFSYGSTIKGVFINQYFEAENNK